MNIRFQGNYQITGSTRAAVQQELQNREQQAKVAVGFVAKAGKCEGDACKTTGDSFVGGLLTEEDAVSFLAQNGIQVDTTKTKAEIDQHLGVALDQKFPPGASPSLAHALQYFSLMLGIMADKLEEIELP